MATPFYIKLHANQNAIELSVMCIMDKVTQYKKILNARRTVLIIFISFPFIVITANALTGNESQTMMIAAFWALLFLVSGLRLQALNTCPWCLKPFLYKVDSIKVMVTQKHNWLTCKTCAYCGEPNAK